MANKSRRERQRENRRRGRFEERLERRNVFGKPDLTPWEAVNNIKNTKQAVS